MESPATTVSSFTSETPVITPRQELRGHSKLVGGVVHLPDRQLIITCSMDDSLRQWDLESGAQIGEDWRDENLGGVRCIALSPNGKTIASGSHSSGIDEGTVMLWNVETRKVIAKWTGHFRDVRALCWSADGRRIAGGSRDSILRVWDVESGETVLTIKTGHMFLNAIMYSPDDTKIATGGGNESAVKIRDSKTGGLITTLKHDIVLCLAWTSDGKKLITGSYGSIRIFDAVTWHRIAVIELEGHTYRVDAISLSPNNRLLASVSRDKTIRLWNLDTNLPIGPPLQHEVDVASAALSADAKVLVTGCENGNVYTWDIHAILKEAGLEDLLPISHVPAQKSLMTSDDTRHPAIDARQIPPGFLDGAQSSATHGTHHHPSRHDPRRPGPSPNPRTPPSGFSSLFRRSRSKTDGATELQHRPRRSIFSRGPRIVEIPTVQDRKLLPSTASTSATPPSPGTHATTAGVAAAQSPPVRWWARLVLFLGCATPPHANGP